MPAHAVSHAARGRSNARIARETGLHLATVRCWRCRFAGHGLAGLSDRRRSGRPPSFTALQVAEVKALARQPASPPARQPASPPRAVCPWRAGHARNWPARSPPGRSPTRSPPSPCAAGWPTTPSTRPGRVRLGEGRPSQPSRSSSRRRTSR
ncbi:helix-turn-helix domain-containing protein [Streptomyces sp. NPDC050549]|uniref:helix-turn-helix domain-containing protein n=1 Tax=Streptomyces sp. NPDC050549 TaxID=3155406 RepID=UPI003446D989